MKRFLLRAFLWSTILCALVYLSACLTPYISPQIFWPMSFLALGYSYLAGLILLLIIAWLFIRKKTSLVLLLVLLAGYKNLGSTFGTHAFKQPIAKPSGSIRIMTWNVRGFDNPSTYLDEPGSVREQMLTFIKDSTPDIICMQEFIEHLGKGMVSTTTEMLDLGYNYFYRTDENAHVYPWGYITSGTTFFSKIPITGSGKELYPDSSFPENIAFIDVAMNAKPLRIFSTHLKSLCLGAVAPNPTFRAKFRDDPDFLYTASDFEKIKEISREHILQARVARDMMDKSPYPYIFCGDMNSVPASYAYNVLSQGLQDAFLLNDFGYGTTMDNLPKPLRIDYLFVDKKVSIENYSRQQLHLSDHFPQMIDVRWKD